jgi:hypothetical protein
MSTRSSHSRFIYLGLALVGGCTSLFVVVGFASLLFTVSFFCLLRFINPPYSMMLYSPLRQRLKALVENDSARTGSAAEVAAPD